MAICFDPGYLHIHTVVGFGVLLLVLWDSSVSVWYL